MRENRLRTAWQQGNAVLCAWLSIPSSFSAELLAHTGFDCLTIDMQHGLIDYQMAVTMLQAISTTPTVPLARVPWNDPGTIMKLLDAGCYGIICPMINNAEEAAAFAASMAPLVLNVRFCNVPINLGVPADVAAPPASAASIRRSRS